jgi:hypothetical protein
MTKLEVEKWAMDIADRTKRKQPVEDSNVEVKSEWIEPVKAARRLAGQANSARGEHILWLIGIDEKNGVVGAEYQNLANWWPQVKSQFDEVAPNLIADVNISLEEKVIVALLFETDRFPYVIKNPTGGNIQFEVPWREGTGIRTARRRDLVMLVTPLQQVPDCDVFKGFLRANIIDNNTLGWYLELPLYIIAKSDTPVIIPFHRCRAEFEIQNVLNRTSFDKVCLESDSHVAVPSQTVRYSRTEIIVKQAGMIKLTSYGRTPMPINRIEIRDQKPRADIKITLLATHADHPIVISETFPQIKQEKEEQWGLWTN